MNLSLEIQQESNLAMHCNKGKWRAVSIRAWPIRLSGPVLMFSLPITNANSDILALLET